MEETIHKISEDILNLAPIISEKLRLGFISNRKNLSQEKPSIINSRAQDVTTDLDHEIGRLFIDKIFKKYKSELTIDSEEKEERLGQGKITLRFDPLDGSKHFVEGIPLIASSAALSVEGEIKFAMVVNPITQDIYHSFKGKGAFLNSNKIRVSSKLLGDDLSFVMYEAPNSKVFSKDVNKFNLFSRYLNQLEQVSYRMRNIGLSTLSICYVADGSSPLYIDLSGTTKLYDVEAAVHIAKESGAVVGTTSGEHLQPLQYSAESDKKELTGNLMVGNPEAWNQAVNLLQN